MSKVTVFIKTRCKPGQREEVYRLWDAHLKTHAEANPQQELIFYCYDQQDENVLYLFEVYSDQAAFEANSKAPWFWDYMNATMPYLDGQPEVGMGTPVYAKGVAVS